MIVILAIDALEYDKVEEYDCKNLKQNHYGKTDISEFSEPRTMVLWSSFITGKNKEKEVMEDGKKEMWNKKWDISKTFFNAFKRPVVIDLPGYSYDIETHESSRELLKQYFEAADKDKKEEIRKEYNKHAFEHHRKVKEQFLNELKEENDIVSGYFSVIDIIGHLNFGNRSMMKMLYKEMEEIVDKIKEITNVKLLILSDHGMKAVGIFGDHSDYGFWSTNFKNLGNPKITDFYDLLVKLK